MFKELMKRRLAPFLIAMITVATCYGLSMFQFVADSPSDGVYNWVNETRQAEGLPALARNKQLDKDAQIRAKEAAQKFSHTRPDGTDWWTVDEALIYGENLAMIYPGNSYTVAYQMWLDSPSHKANIMDVEYGETGIGVYVDKNGYIFIAQEFGLTRKK